MDQLIFTVYDSAAEVYLPPFFVPNIGLATRAFEDCINSKEHQFGKHPHDYTLFILGDYDQSTGLFNTNAPKSIGNGLQFVKAKPPPDEQGDWVNGQSQSAVPNNENRRNTTE